MRNALAHAGKSGRRVVSAFIATALAQDDAANATRQWRAIADQLRPKLPKPATLMDDAEPDVLSSMDFPAQHRAKLHSTNPLERLNREIKRRTEVVGARRPILPLEEWLCPPQSPTRPPSYAWSAPSCLSKTTNGLPSEPAT
jgi:transposase-like protein